MKYLTLLALLVITPSFAGFKVTVLSTDKPDIKKNDAPVDKPIIKLTKEQDSVSSPNLPTLNQGADEVEKEFAKSDARTHKAAKPLSKPVINTPAPIERGEPAQAAVGDLSIEPKSKYAELKQLKQEKQKIGKTMEPVKVESLLDVSEPIKPLFELTQGDTFSGVLERWADTERLRVVFDLGVWDRIQDLKMTVNYLFTTELKSSVKQFLELLNNTPNLKSNNVTLHACFFENPYVMITTNPECEV